MSVSPKSLVGVAAAIEGSSPTRTALTQFHLVDHVAIVTGAQRGIGLEMALAMAEAGATVYCLDLPSEPNQVWLKVKEYADNLPALFSDEHTKKGRLQYRSADVTNQEGIWKLVEEIAQKEGRLDICIANAGILAGAECLNYPAKDFRKIIDVNVDGVFFTAQAAGRQMERFGIKGSIIMTASMSGSIANKDQHWIAYNTSKAAVVQMARSMACELGPKGIRVNSVSPGYIYTQMTQQFLDSHPRLMEEWSSQNPLGRLGQPDELRGVALWLASSASTFCTGSDIIVDGGHRAW